MKVRNLSNRKKRISKTLDVSMKLVSKKLKQEKNYPAMASNVSSSSSIPLVDVSPSDVISAASTALSSTMPTTSSIVSPESSLESPVSDERLEEIP